MLRTAAVLIAAAILALTACGGSDDPARDELKSYLRDAGRGIRPLFIGVVPAAEFLQGRAPSDEPPSKAALRVDAAVKGYREAKSRMAKLDPPSDLRDEHLALLESFDDVAAEYARLADAMREGPAAVEALNPGSGPGVAQAGPTFRRWSSECGRAADDADLKKPDWLEALLEP